jgi:hypothetical protein
MRCQAALFAGFLSTFLIELLGRLEQDPINIIQDVLIYQTQMMRNSSLGPYVPPDFSPPEHIVIVNALFYASLGAMILAAFIAMLIKSWVREFDRGLRAMSLPEQRAKTREFRYLGMERWKLPEMVGILPLLIQISLLLFSIGLILFLFHISTPAFGVTTAVFGIGMLYYGMTTSISVFVTSSPFHSPLSRALATLYQRAHILLYLFLQRYTYADPEMDIISPVTSLGRLRRSIHFILQTSLPYLETYFEYPVAETSMDAIQIHRSTVASALQRVHDDAPLSQHSEALQWSVWQVAGSATLNTPPLFRLPNWIFFEKLDEEYFLHRPPSMLVAVVAVSLRGPDKWRVGYMTTVRALLQRMDTSNVPWAQVVGAVFDNLNCSLCDPDEIEHLKHLKQTESSLTNVTRRMELPTEESLWLLSALSEIRSESWRPEREPFLIGICLAILSDHAPKWQGYPGPQIESLEAVVTLAAMSCSPQHADRLHIFTSSREDPCSLQNVRSPALFANWFEDTPSEYHKQLISLLFLVTYALICRLSYALAVQYLTIITAKGDLPLYTSSLIAIASRMRVDRLSAISRMLVVSRRQELTPEICYSMLNRESVFPEELLQNYDLQLGASENPDPNLLAIVFMLSKNIPSDTIEELKGVNLELKNPWLRLAARVVARLDIPDGSGLPIRSFYDHRVHNMIAALSLLRYSLGTVTQYTEFLLLESFLESRELSISSTALEYYMQTAISYPDPPAPSYCLSVAVSAAFKFILPDHLLWMGWTILASFVDGFDKLSVGWQRAFAEGFFALCRRPLLKARGDEPMARDSELEQILTWEYFHEEEQEPEWTDSEFSGLDWMAMAWSLHLSQKFAKRAVGLGQEKAKSRNLSGPRVNEEFVLRALCKLLDAAPPYQLIPVLPKLREIVQWFDGPELPEHRQMISKRIREAVRMHEEFQKLLCFHKFHKFHCTLYI